MSEEPPRGRNDEDLREFLRSRVESFDQLEALLLLRRHRNRPWSAPALAERLGIDRSAAEGALEHLCRRNLLNVRVGSQSVLFEYAPENAGLSEWVDRLAHAYEASRLQVMKLISAQANERDRTRALRLFADAFILGRKKDG